VAPRPDEPARVELNDPRAIRAIAHPARLAVLDELYQRGNELTATECGELVGLSASAMSYHLRALERWGVIERAPSSADRRERPWRRAGRDLTVRISEPSSVSANLATDVLVASSMDGDRRALREVLQRVATGAAVPIDEAATYSRAIISVTPQEARELLAEVWSRIEGLRSENRVDAPADAVELHVSLLAVPVESAAKPLGQDHDPEPDGQHQGGEGQ